MWLPYVEEYPAQATCFGSFLNTQLQNRAVYDLRRVPHSVGKAEAKEANLRYIRAKRVKVRADLCRAAEEDALAWVQASRAGMSRDMRAATWMQAGLNALPR